MHKIKNYLTLLLVVVVCYVIIVFKIQNMEKNKVPIDESNLSPPDTAKVIEQDLLLCNENEEKPFSCQTMDLTQHTADEACTDSFSSVQDDGNEFSAQQDIMIETENTYLPEMGASEQTQNVQMKNQTEITPTPDRDSNSEESVNERLSGLSSFSENEVEIKSGDEADMVVTATLIPEEEDKVEEQWIEVDRVMAMNPTPMPENEGTEVSSETDRVVSASPTPIPEKAAAVTPTSVPEEKMVMTLTPIPEKKMVMTPTPMPESKVEATPTPIPEEKAVMTPTPIPEKKAVMTPTPIPEEKAVMTPTPIPEKKVVMTPTPMPESKMEATPTPMPEEKVVVMTPTPVPENKVEATPTIIQTVEESNSISQPTMDQDAMKAPDKNSEDESEKETEGVTDQTQTEEIETEAKIMVDNVAGLRNGSFVENDIVYTRGYYDIGDGGAASYTIQKIAQKEDGVQYITLLNGLTAQLNVKEDDYIDVRQAGIIPNEDITDRLNTLIKAVDEKAKGIVFPDGKYIVSKQINLKSMEYIGSTATELWVSEDFQTTGCAVFTNLHEYEQNKTGKECTIRNINFTFEACDNQSFQGSDAILLCLSGMEECIIDHCNFRSTITESSRYSRQVTLLWFHDGDTKNVTISNSNFYNYVPTQLAGNHWIGGCIWLSCFENDRVIDNVTIYNCNMVSYAADEVIGVWGARQTSHFTIDSCELTVSGKSNDNMVTFKGSNYQDINIVRSTFNVEAPCTNVVKLLATTNMGSYQVDIDQCNFNLKNGMNELSRTNMSVVGIIGVADSTSTVNLRNSFVTSEGATRYRTCVTVINSNYVTVNMDYNTFNFSCASGIYWVENASGNYSATNNYMNLIDLCTLFVLRNTLDNCALRICNNEIHNRINGLLQQNIHLLYDFCENNIVFDGKCAVLQNGNVILSHDSPGIAHINNNIYANRNNIYFGSNWETDRLSENLIIDSTDGY